MHSDETFFSGGRRRLEPITAALAWLARDDVGMSDIGLVNPEMLAPVSG